MEGRTPQTRLVLPLRCDRERRQRRRDVEIERELRGGRRAAVGRHPGLEAPGGDGSRSIPDGVPRSDRDDAGSDEAGPCGGQAPTNPVPAPRVAGTKPASAPGRGSAHAPPARLTRPPPAPTARLVY